MGDPSSRWDKGKDGFVTPIPTTKGNLPVCPKRKPNTLTERKKHAVLEAAVLKRRRRYAYMDK